MSFSNVFPARIADGAPVVAGYHRAERERASGGGFACVRDPEGLEAGSGARGARVGDEIGRS